MISTENRKKLNNTANRAQVNCYNFAVKSYIQRNRRTITYDIIFNHEALLSNLFNISGQTECYPGLNKL